MLGDVRHSKPSAYHLALSLPQTDRTPEHLSLPPSRPITTESAPHYCIIPSISETPTGSQPTTSNLVWPDRATLAFSPDPSSAGSAHSSILSIILRAQPEQHPRPHYGCNLERVGVRSARYARSARAPGPACGQKKQGDDGWEHDSSRSPTQSRRHGQYAHSGPPF